MYFCCISEEEGDLQVLLLHHLEGLSLEFLICLESGLRIYICNKVPSAAAAAVSGTKF